MKKIISILLVSILALSALAGCSGKDTGSSSAEDKTITVGASITPHAEILKVAKEILAKQGYTLNVIEFNDYVQPNLNLESGELDANYFQHKPYLDDFNTENKTHLVSAAAIHYEPFGIYPGKTKAIADLKNGATISVPNDGTNEARALFLLEANGLITLKKDVGFTATVVDIATNPKNITIQEIDAAQLARSLQDVDLAVINGNYAIQAGLKVGKDALATEDKNSVSADTYANIVAVKAGNENTAKTLALVAALKSNEVKTFIETTYEGAVIAKF